MGPLINGTRTTEKKKNKNKNKKNSMILAQRQKYRPRVKMESPEINPRAYGHLIFDKGGKSRQWSIDNYFKKRCWEKCSTTCKRKKLEHCLTPYTK